MKMVTSMIALENNDIALLKEHHKKCSYIKREVESNFGSISNFLGTLQFEKISDSAHASFQEFYDLYKSIFTLSDESESMDGFATVLDLNNRVEIQNNFGPFEEEIFAIRDPRSSQIIAAANFVKYAFPNNSELAYDGSCQLNFILVHKDSRGLGIADILLDKIESEMIAYTALYANGHNFFITCEQNNPDKMSPKEISDDVHAALIDPIKRMAWWRRHGYKKLDFPYIQPALGTSSAPCNYLDYYIKICSDESNPQTISSSILLEHLRRFMFVSIGKFEVDMSKDSSWMAMSHFISSKRYIAIR